MATDYFKTVNAVVKHGRMTNSYKPALLRALSDYGAGRESSPSITWEWLAEQFLCYYWPLTVTYKLRQATVHDKDPVIMQLIRGEVDQLNLPSNSSVSDYKNRHREAFETVVSRLSTPGRDCCLDEVVPRFHNVSRQSLAKLYKEKDRAILLSRGSLKFLQDNHETLRLLSIGRWVKFTEKYSAAPRLYEKIEDKPRRNSLTRYRKTLNRLNLDVRCFYCEGLLEEEYDVEHFIPWSFVFEDKLWNLVAACSGCNGDKDVSIPSRSWLEKLHKRNSQLAEMSQDPMVKRDLGEWKIRSLEQHLNLLCDTASAEGFASWEPSLS